MAMGMALLAACTGGGGPATAPATRSPAAVRPRLVPCTVRGDLLCGSVDVPLDRANASAGTISVTFYVHPHSDTGAPAAEPVFTMPGGPGSSGLSAMEFVLQIGTILAHHDVVAVDARGTGRSGVIECPDLQNGWSDAREMNAAVRACGEHMGGSADRYGSGDVAMDVEAVRRALGYDRIDFYAYSYGAVPEQAYAARFPGRVHALVFDAGMSVTDPDHVWAWELGVPGALVRTVSLMCSRDPACTVDDPGATIRWVVHRTAAEPLRGAVKLPGGKPQDVVVDEAEVAKLLQSTGTCVACGQIAASQLLSAVTSFRRGRPDALLRLAKVHSRGPLAIPPAASDFSAGDNIAAFCNDQDFVWNRSDPVGVRARKFRAALATLPDDAFAPFSKQGWSAFSWPAGCLLWPAPDRFEPAIPHGVVFPDVPTLILAGDSDTIVPSEVVETLRAEFPDAAFVTVAGAGHPVAGPAWGHCAAALVARLFDTLGVGDAACAAVPG